MKKLFPLLVLSAGLAACAPAPVTQMPSGPQIQPTMPPAPAPSAANLQEITLNTELQQYSTDWMYIFRAVMMMDGAGQPSPSMRDRVASFSSAEALRQDTLNNLQSTDIPANQHQAIANAFVQRVSQQVDFSKNDLVVAVLSDGGPPFGQYRYTPTSPFVIEFCIDKPANPSGISGMALSTTVKYYTASKGTTAVMCQRRM